MPLKEQKQRGGKVMSVGNSTREHLEIFHSLILQTNCHGFTRQQQGSCSTFHYRLFHLLQGPSMMKIKLEPYIHLCNNLFFEKETINFTVI